VLNVDEAGLDGNAHSAKAEAFAKQRGMLAVVISAAIEAEVAQLPPEDQGDYLSSLGLKETGLARVVRAGYQLLDLVTFFTVGPKEARAWTVRREATAPVAAGVIHTDSRRASSAPRPSPTMHDATSEGRAGASRCRQTPPGRRVITPPAMATSFTSGSTFIGYALNIGAAARL
jgi:ribosome-binding ATPase YchF (GTP1/OBG family)